MENQTINLISPKGTLIVATLERLNGRALIVPSSVRVEPTGGFSFDYEGTTDIYWDDQRTVVENDERVFVDEEGTEYLESELRLVPQQQEQESLTKSGTLSQQTAGNRRKKLQNRSGIPLFKIYFAFSHIICTYKTIGV